MVKLHEIYPRTTSRILHADLPDLAMPLEIIDVEITGENKKTVWLSFEGTNLKHKCSRKDVFVLADNLGTNETDDFKDKKIKLVKENEKVIVEPTKKKK